LQDYGEKAGMITLMFFKKKMVKRQKTASGFSRLGKAPPRKELAWKMNPLSSPRETIPPLPA